MNVPIYYLAWSGNSPDPNGLATSGFYTFSPPDDFNSCSAEVQANLATAVDHMDATYVLTWNTAGSGGNNNVDIRITVEYEDGGVTYISDQLSESINL